VYLVQGNDDNGQPRVKTRGVSAGRPTRSGGRPQRAS
jgi:hypothetical protein